MSLEAAEEKKKGLADMITHLGLTEAGKDVIRGVRIYRLCCRCVRLIRLPRGQMAFVVLPSCRSLRPL